MLAIEVSSVVKDFRSLVGTFSTPIGSTNLPLQLMESGKCLILKMRAEVCEQLHSIAFFSKDL